MRLQRALSALQIAKEKGCPENLLSYIEGLLYKNNKIGRSLIPFKRYKNACDLFKKSNFTTSLAEWMLELKNSPHLSEYAMILKTLIQLDPSFAASNPVQAVLGCYGTEVDNLLRQVSFPECLFSKKEILEETQKELFVLLSESTDYIQKNWQSAMGKEAFYLGVYSLLSELELELTQQERIKLLKDSREVLEVARAHGDRMARGMLVYNYLMLEFLDKDGNEYYKHAAALLEELGVKFVPVNLQHLLKNIKEYFQNEASDEAHLKDFFELVCNDIAHNIDNYECFSEEIKEIIERERTIISLPISVEPSQEFVQENKIPAVTREVEALETHSEALLPSLDTSKADNSMPSLLYRAAKLNSRPTRKLQKPKEPNNRQKLLEKILSSKQKETPKQPLNYKISFANANVRRAYYRYETDPNFQHAFGEVIAAIESDPFGLENRKGKHELLRGNYSGHWSRRLRKGERIVYTVLPNGVVKIVEVGGHYQQSK